MTDHAVPTGAPTTSPRDELVHLVDQNTAAAADTAAAAENILTELRGIRGVLDEIAALLRAGR